MCDTPYFLEACSLTLSPSVKYMKKTVPYLLQHHLQPHPAICLPIGSSHKYIQIDYGFFGSDVLHAYACVLCTMCV